MSILLQTYARSPKSSSLYWQHSSFFFLTGSLFGFILSSLVFVHKINSKDWIALSTCQSISSKSKHINPASVFRTYTTYNKFNNTVDNTISGWKQIDVFTGNSLEHLEDVSTITTSYLRQAQWFSQVRQDEVVYKLLNNKKNGYFVDLAANDAVHISNTFALERSHGWTGLCIEPNSAYWNSLAYRSCHVVASVIGAQRMQEVMFKFPNRAGPQGGIVGHDFDNQYSSKYGEDQRRYTVTFREVLERYNAPSVIDYLSLDVEGAEEYVMKDFPFDKYQISVMTIERPKDRLQSLLKSKGYVMVKKLKKYDTLWIHGSIQNSIDQTALDIDTEHYSYTEKLYEK